MDTQLCKHKMCKIILKILSFMKEKILCSRMHKNVCRRSKYHLLCIRSLSVAAATDLFPIYVFMYFFTNLICFFYRVNIKSLYHLNLEALLLIQVFALTFGMKW